MGALNLNACAVAIHDEALYGDMGDAGASEVHFLSPGQETISKSQWDTLRFGMVCMSQPSFSDFKQEIEELCSRTSCGYDVQQAVKMIFAKIESLRLK